ncbi:MAG: winged helix-turn-helix transcriptional regulator [Bacteroidales bacterium]|nr:winged helix-turn-helix transcriptional regulator [Bacteroidales bacterium]
MIRNSFKRVNSILDIEDKFEYEIIRMDEFLAKTSNPGTVISRIMMLMSAYRSISGAELGIKTELIVSVGIGPVEYMQHQLRESDGSAFRLAINGLNRLKRSQRIIISTEDENITDEFKVTCGFMDILIREWSDEQAEALFLKLTGNNQVQISEKLGISQPAVNRRLKAAHSDTTERFIKRTVRLLS